MKTLKLILLLIFITTITFSQESEIVYSKVKYIYPGHRGGTESSVYDFTLFLKNSSKIDSIIFYKNSVLFKSNRRYKDTLNIMVNIRTTNTHRFDIKEKTYVEVFINNDKISSEIVKNKNINSELYEKCTFYISGYSEKIKLNISEFDRGEIVAMP